MRERLVVVDKYSRQVGNKDSITNVKFGVEPPHQIAGDLMSPEAHTLGAYNVCVGDETS